MAVFTASQHSTSDAFKMNQLCKVCGEPAAGFHFGAFTCEGCKSFFGRSYNNLSVISECKNGGQCVINKKNRTSCKACRLRKCLLVGMSKSGSRYGRRSNWFKLHCLMQEQNPSAPAGSADPLHMRTRGLHSSPQAMISGLKGAVPCSSMSSNESKDDAEDYKTSTSPSISSPGSQHSDSSVDLTETKSPSLTLNPFALKLAHPKLCDGFPSMAFLPPHLQAAAGFFPTGFPQPRFLFPAMTAFALSGSPPGGLPATAVRSSRKFNIDSMIPLSKSSPELPLIAQEAEQDTPIDLSVKRPFKRLRPDEDFPSDESDMESTDPAEDDADETQDPDEENDSSERGLESKDPLDLTRK